MAALHEFVESANNVAGFNDEGSYTADNSVYTSNHKGATAFDYNWKDHPMGKALAGWFGSDIINGPQEPEIRRLLEHFSLTLPNGKKLYLVFWANDWNSPKDSMHFQMGYQTYENQLAIWDWINKHILPDGRSDYRRPGGKPIAGAPMPTINEAKLLGDAMGNVPGVDYDLLLPFVADCLRKSNCHNNNRIAMWCAQIGHESVGLRYMKEIGDAKYFSKYNNRADLGNGPSDGPRYPGRGPIQVTGRFNYRQLSLWAYQQGYVTSPAYFEDNPTELERLQFAFLGAIWYWTVARSDINALCDKGDLDTVTRRINGGTHGLADRRDRWNRARAMDLTPLYTEDGDEDEMAGWDPDLVKRAMVLLENTAGVQRPSLSPLRWPGETFSDTSVGYGRRADALSHFAYAEKLAVDYGDVETVGLLLTVAACADNPQKWPDRQWDAGIAKKILAKVPNDVKADGWDHVATWLAAEAANS